MDENVHMRGCLQADADTCGHVVHPPEQHWPLALIHTAYLKQYEMRNLQYKYDKLRY